MMRKAWFLLSPIVWFAVVWGTIGAVAAVVIGLLSFICAVSVYLLADRYRLPGTGSLAAGSGLIGPFLIASVATLFGLVDGARAPDTVSVTRPAET